MSRGLIDLSIMDDIANAINLKLSSSGTMTPSQMASNISSIPTMGTLVSKTISANGTYSASSDNADGYDVVTVDLPLSSTTFLSNGTYYAASDNLEGYSEVIVSVPNTYTSGDEGKVVSGGSLVTQTSSSITQNGTLDTTLINSVTVDLPLDSVTFLSNGVYYASSSSLEGFTEVTVSVPSPSLISVSFSSNNTYIAPSGYGYDQVTVDVPTISLSTINISANGSYTALSNTGFDQINVSVPTEVAGVKGDVTYYDYDGGIIKSYSKEDFLQLTEHPSNPVHTGLTSQGWNWSLANAKAFVTEYGWLNIGQIYKPTDGSSWVVIELGEGRLNPSLYLYVNGSVTVDWGDNTTPDTVTGSGLSTLISSSHTYAAAGEYIISILPSTGSTFSFATPGSGSNLKPNLLMRDNSLAKEYNIVYRNAVKGIHIGDNCTLKSYNFRALEGLEYITFPEGLTSIPDNLLYNCITLKLFITPSSLTNLESAICTGCSSLEIASLSNSITSTLTFIFKDCTNLKEVNFPNSAESGSGTLNGCLSLIRTNIPNTQTITPNLIKCRNLKSIVIPSSITEFKTEAFSQCNSLASIEIPANVTLINTSAFYQCYGLGSIKFYPSVPPTISGTGVFYSVPTDCIIYVPSGTLTDYTTAPSYPSSASYTYIEY